MQTPLTGSISDWNVSLVTDMSNAFDGRATFEISVGGMLAMYEYV